MFNLLKVKVTGFRMLEDNFTIDLVNKARVSLDCDSESSREIIEIDKNLYTYNLIALTGSNSSGKSTTLDLLKKVLQMMQTGRWFFNKIDFNNDNIKLHIEFYLDGDICIDDIVILPLENYDKGSIVSPFCKITNEKLRIGKYDEKAGRNYAEKLEFYLEERETGIDDTSKLIFLCKDKSNIYYIPEFQKNGVLVNNMFYDSLNFFSKGLTSEIIRLLDESIEYIIFDGKENVRFKRFNKEEINIPKNELISLLSNGTIKGIDLYIRVIMLLKTGGVMIIDEIENCFHKNLVNNLLFLIKDKSLNKNNAQIIFSTHYVEILDIFERRDNIFIMHKKNNQIKISNLYEDYGIRTEILKSKLFNNNTFNTMIDYNQLMVVLRMLKYEISYTK